MLFRQKTDISVYNDKLFLFIICKIYFESHNWLLQGNTFSPSIGIQYPGRSSVIHVPLNTRPCCNVVLSQVSDVDRHPTIVAICSLGLNISVSSIGMTVNLAYVNPRAIWRSIIIGYEDRMNI